MKAVLFDSHGKKKQEISLPQVFNTTIREDIAAKLFEAEKVSQPYSPDPDAGNKQSACGRIRHIRHKWRTHYGKGISRIPRKTMWRRGTQFYWVGASIPGARGGRQAHPPKGTRKERKINKKEVKIAIDSAIASTADKNFILKRYSSLKEIKNLSLPAVIESLPKKTKELDLAINSIFNEIPQIVRQKSVRSGRGKMKGRKHKVSAGLLILTSKDEEIKTNGIAEQMPISNVKIADLYPLGRITLFTKKSLEELEAKK